MTGRGISGLDGPRLAIPQTIRHLANPFRATEAWAQRFGDPFRLPLMHGEAVVTGRPELVRQVFAADPDLFGIVGLEVIENFVGTRSILVATGARHRRLRQVISPPFHGERMHAYAAATKEITERAFRSLPWGRPQSAILATREIALNVIFRAVFGIADEATRSRLRGAVLEAVQSQNVLLFIRHLRRAFFGLGPWARYQRAKKALDQQLLEVVQRARAQRDLSSRKDVLALLLQARHEDGTGLDDGELVDQLVTLLEAGYVTTSIAMAWGIYFTLRHPEVFADLRRALDGLDAGADIEEVANREYLGALVNESLRLYPAIPDISRLLLEDFRLGDTLLPRGTAIIIPLNLLHRDETLYPNPTRFDPTRFLRHQFKPHEFIPFGGGARRCIGSALATYEMKVALATIFSRFRMRLAHDMPSIPRRHSLLMAPSDGVQIVIDGER